MAEVETKQAELETLSEKPSVETSTAPAESVSDNTASNKQLIEEKQSAEKTDGNSEVTKASQVASENATKIDTESTEPSKRVQEAQAYNNRDRDHDRGRGRARGRGGRSRGNNFNRGPSYKHNIKSDMTSQEESSDPVEIRKQVQLAVIPLESSC